MSEDIPQWAIDRAMEELRGSILGEWEADTKVIYAFARYIAAHEQPPVDPDVIAVREILSAWEREPDGYILSGGADISVAFQEALAAYRRHKEAGK